MAAKASALVKMLKFFKDNEKKQLDYYVPSLWLGDNDGESKPTKVNAYQFFKESIEKIVKERKEGVDYSKSLSQIENKQHGRGGEWTYLSRIYNCFPRLATAYDHDQDGHVGFDEKDTTLSKNGVRETGTFLKTIALLHYIKSLGVNTLYCLPTTSIGKDGNRGDLGSPYAIKNPYKLDENLADPLIPNMGVEEQFKALVEACHILGIRVVLEFVLRTSSLDGEWIKEHPDWFYWIDRSRADEYKTPVFPSHELAEILMLPKGRGWHYAPNYEYRSLFKKPPLPEQIRIEDGKYVATTEEGELIIPGAFADWPPDDIQPPWSDVTYYRMYNYSYEAPYNNYNYIAYNTIRYYDPELAKPDNANKPLWEQLSGVIPHYQKSFGIDGVMMDMGHAVPVPLMQEIISNARTIDIDFAFCEENFEIMNTSREAGYNAVLGFEWRVSAAKGGIKRVVQKAGEWLPLPFFGTPETHNTPRAMQRGGMPHSQLCWVVNSFLPNCIPFIHNGFEICEDFPVNTGLNFFQYETDYYSNHRLPLFFKSALKWDTKNNIIGFIKHVNKLREEHATIIANGNEHSIRVLYPEDAYGHVVAFERFDPYHQYKTILVIANTNYEHEEKFYLRVDGTGNRTFADYISGHNYTFVDGWISITLGKGQCVVFVLEKSW
jgi:hypothetical protein